MRTLDRGTIEHTTLHRSMFPCALIEYGRTFANKYCICRGKTWSKRLQGEGGFRSHPYPFPLLKSDELERCIKVEFFSPKYASEASALSKDSARMLAEM